MMVEAVQEFWGCQGSPCSSSERALGMTGEHHSLGTHENPGCLATWWSHGTYFDAVILPDTLHAVTGHLRGIRSLKGLYRR